MTMVSASLQETMRRAWLLALIAVLLGLALGRLLLSPAETVDAAQTADEAESSTET